MAASISAVSTEYVHVPVTASVTLDAQVVEMAFLTTGNPTAATQWITAAWTGDPGTTRTAELLVGPDTTVPLAVGTVNVFVRVHDSPEIPVRSAGSIKVT